MGLRVHGPRPKIAGRVTLATLRSTTATLRLRLRARPPDAQVQPADVTIIVLNWNRRDDTLACLASLGQADLGGARVMVVDNGSRDESVAAVRERFPEVQVVVLDQNQGFAGGNNAGVRVAMAGGAKAVCLLNNDTEVAPEFLHLLLHVLNGQRRAAAVASAILRADSPQVLDVAWLDIYFGHGLVHRRGVNALPGEGFDTIRTVEAGIGCCLLMAADALGDIGLLDEAYFAYHEEVDWCYRARRRGWRIFYQPFARVWHHGSRSTGVLTAPRTQRGVSTKPQLNNPIPLSWNPVRTYLGARNAVRFVRTHGTLTKQVYYVLSSLYAVPLELLAVVMGGEEELMLGLWTYRRALARYCLEMPDDGQPVRGAVGRWLRALGRAPARLARDLPRDIRQAHADGETAQLVEHLRGMRDGIRNRPLPLARLGLQ